MLWCWCFWALNIGQSFASDVYVSLRPLFLNTKPKLTTRKFVCICWPFLIHGHIGRQIDGTSFQHVNEISYRRLDHCYRKTLFAQNCAVNHCQTKVFIWNISLLISSHTVYVVCINVWMSLWISMQCCSNNNHK